MKKQPVYLWITVLALGLCFDFLFYKHPFGISFALFAILTLVAGFILLGKDKIRPARTTLFLLPLILFFILFTTIRMEPMSVFLAYGFTLFLMAGLTVTYQGGKWVHYNLADYFIHGADFVRSLFAGSFIFAMLLRRHQNDLAVPQKPSGQFWPILRGLGMAIPVVAFFALLLSSADMVFSQRLNELLLIFRLENLSEYIFRLSYILIIAYTLGGVYLHAAQRSGDDRVLGLEKPLLAPYFGFTEASIILGSVILLFASFVLIQFQYFFGGQANITLTGFTYAEYARKGFGELVMVSFFAMLLFLVLTSATKRETPTRKKIFSGLGLALFALVSVMLVSAYMRLGLYEAAYGFTRLRTYTHIFMIWTAILLAAVIVLDIVQQPRYFALSALLVSLGFAVSLVSLNVDAFIFQRNLARFEQGKTLDVGYLASLSSDAVPEMVQVYTDTSSSVNAGTHDRVGAVLACYNNSNNRAIPAWQTFEFSIYWAETALKGIAPSINAYKIDNSNWPATVLTPLGATYDCSSTSMMD